MLHFERKLKLRLHSLFSLFFARLPKLNLGYSLNLPEMTHKDFPRLNKESFSTICDMHIMRVLFKGFIAVYTAIHILCGSRVKMMNFNRISNKPRTSWLKKFGIWRKMQARVSEKNKLQLLFSDFTLITFLKIEKSLRQWHFSSRYLNKSSQKHRQIEVSPQKLHQA